MDKKWMLFRQFTILVVSLVTIVLGNNLAQAQTFNSSPALRQPFGTVLGSFNGVATHSNGSVGYVSNIYNKIHNKDGVINTGMEWQCVEYVNRYYYQRYKVNIRIAGDNANNYYNGAQARGLVNYPNGSTTPPKVGDILCFGGGATGLGHVAIIKEVLSTGVRVIHQNWSNTFDDANHFFSGNMTGGNYIINNPSGYMVQGWLRKLSSPTLSVSLIANPQSGTVPLKGVDFTATVSGTATGTINYTFYANRSDSGTNITPGYCFKIDGRNPNGTGGTVVYRGTATSWSGGTTFTVRNVYTYTSAGTYTAKVIAERGSSSPAEARVTITVSTPSPDFTFLPPNPATQIITQGNSTSYAVSLKPLNGYNSPVSLSVTGISPSPGNDNPITYSFSPSTVTPPATTKLNISTLRTIIPQTYTISIRGQDGTKIHDTSVQLVVNPSPLNGAISGKVYAEESGNPLDGVAIQATQVTQSGNWQQRGSTTTQGGGNYKLQGLIPGQYYVSAQRSGFGTVIKTDISVLSGQETSNQNLSMTNNPGWIYGTVKDANNAAVENLNVRVTVKGAQGRVYCITSANTASGTGYYELHDLEEGNNYQVRTNGTTINNIDYAFTTISGVSVQKGQGTNINLVLQQAARIYGTVKDTQGNPVKGVRINCWADNGNISGNGDTTTDEGGNYKDYNLRYLLPGYTYTVDVTPSPDTDYVAQRFQVNVPSAGNYENDITLQSGAIKISGNVKVKATQQPPQDTTVEIGYWNRQYSVWEGAYINQQDGSYVLTNLPKEGEVEIRVMPESVYAWDGIVGNFQQDAVVNFELVPEAVISGVINDFDKGLPITASLDISYSNEDKGINKSFSTNSADGTFSLTGLPSGLAEAMVKPQVETGYAWKRAYFYLSEGEHSVNIVFFIKKGALVSGILKDTVGTGIPNKEILIDGSRGEETKIYTDINGNFQIRLSGGNYVAGLVDTDMRDWTVIPQEFTITGPSDNKTIELIGYNPSNANYISGEVINTGGYPKTSAFIVVAMKAGGVWNKETIRDPKMVSMAGLDNAGPYQLMVPPGYNYDLCLGVFAGKVVSSFTKRDAIASVSGGSTGENLYYDSVGGTISGTVTHNGQPVIMATVYLTDLTGNFVGFANTIDAAGTYHLYNVPAGNYIISAWHPDYGESTNFPVNGLTDNGTITADIVIQ